MKKIRKRSPFLQPLHDFIGRRLKALSGRPCREWHRRSFLIGLESPIATNESEVDQDAIPSRTERSGASIAPGHLFLPRARRSDSQRQWSRSGEIDRKSFALPQESIRKERGHAEIDRDDASVPPVFPAVIAGCLVQAVQKLRIE